MKKFKVYATTHAHVCLGEFDAETRDEAIERSNGDKHWYLNGEEVTKTEVMKPERELTVEQISEKLGYNVKIVKG